jgi:hypothetical protein
MTSEPIVLIKRNDDHKKRKNVLSHNISLHGIAVNSPP